VTRGHLRRILYVEVSLRHQPLDEVVEQLRELGLLLGGALTAQRLEHCGRELIRSHEGINDRLAEGVHRALTVLAEIEPEVRRIASARESGLKQEIREVVEQRLEVYGIGLLGAELRVRMTAHDERYDCRPSAGQEPAPRAGQEPPSADNRRLRAGQAPPSADNRRLRTTAAPRPGPFLDVT
jgi:hypothetical protein